MVAVTAAVTATAAGGNVGGPSVLNISVNTRLASSVTIRATTKHVASDRPLAARTSSAKPGRLPKNAKQRSVSAHANASQKNINQTTRSDGGNSRSTLDDASSRSAPASERDGALDVHRGHRAILAHGAAIVADPSTLQDGGGCAKPRRVRLSTSRIGFIGILGIRRRLHCS